MTADLHLELRSWTECVSAHRARLEPVLSAHRRRRSAGEAHPVIDFLFTYYRFRPKQLESWSPGLGVAVREANRLLENKSFVRASDGTIALDPKAFPERLGPGTIWIRDLLAGTQDRPPFLGCYGLHEWAMVYQADERRHSATPLRLPRPEIDRVVEGGSLACTHYDAFRFFTEAARPLNRHALTVESMPEREQPGCLHANMDLYRWAFKRSPWIASDLIADAFLLALDIRAVDMRASPYDLAAFGYAPIPIETAQGRAEYREHQLRFARRAQPIRGRLIAAYDRLIEAVGL